MKDTLKLYKVTLRGMTHNSTGVAHGINYVIAQNPDEAYRKVRDYLDKEDIGFSYDRELNTIELLAEDYSCTDTRIRLFL